MPVQGAKAGRVELPYDDMALVTRMVRYCYLMDYDDAKSERETNYTSPVHLNAQMVCAR